MTRKTPRLLSDQTASTAAEFAMVLPLLLLLMIGLVEAGRFMWTCNRAEKATQMGARYAVATDIVPAGLDRSQGKQVRGGQVGDVDVVPDEIGRASCRERV